MRSFVASLGGLLVLLGLGVDTVAQTPASREAVAEAHRLAQESFRPMVPHVYFRPAIGPWGMEWVPYSVMLGAQPPVAQQQVQTGPGAWVSRPLYPDRVLPAVPPAQVEVSVTPPSPPAPPMPVPNDFAPNNAEDLVSAAETSLRSGNLSAALEQVDRALAADSQFGYAHLIRSQILFALARIPESVAALNTATELLAPDLWMQPVTNFRSTFGPDEDQASRRYVTWLQVVESTVRTEPDNIPARVLLGYHYAAVGFKDPAIAHLQEVVRRQPDQPTALRLLKRLGVVIPASAQREF